MQLADDHSRRPSVFTSAVVEGLATGDADRDQDGWVSLNELYDYVFDRVREQNPNQTPSRDVEMQGELYLARSRRRRIKPQPIPTDLQAAMTADNMFSRLGAVSELRTRLLSDNLPAAVGAHQALVEIAQTDIHSVAEPARAAVREAVLHATETELRFDPIRYGAEPPHSVVHLLGPPVARICTAQASADWIHVEETAGGFDISVDTLMSATGTLTLKGPTGELELPVSLTVLPAEEVPAAGEAAVSGSSTGPYQPRVSVAVQDRPLMPHEPPRRETHALEGEPKPRPASAGTPEVRRVVYVPPAASMPPPSPAQPATRRSTGAEIGSVLWALIPLLSFGLLAFVPSVHAAIRLKKPVLWLTAVVYAAMLAVFLVAPTGNTPASVLYFLMWIGATIHAFVLRPRVFSPLGAVAPVRRPVTGGPVRALVPHFKVVALGIAGSGKTVYLSSMFHTANVPAATRSYFLETGASQRIYLSKVFDEVSDTTEPWPRGTRTGETRELVFDCASFDQGTKHEVFSISFLDYAGELLESEQTAGSTALGDLETRIRSAHGLLGMLDGYRVLQFLRGEPAGLRYFRSSIQPMTGIMAGATCPIHFVLTKWDLIRGFGEPADADDNLRLSLVRDALMNTAQLRALVETHSWIDRIVRLIPVSAVGPDFAQMASDGRILKLPNGEVHPTNVEVPLSAIIPDLFRQVELSLDPATRRQLGLDARARRGPRFSMAAFLNRPAGAALGRKLEEVVGGSAGREVTGMFLDWMGGTPLDEARAAGKERRDGRRRAATVEAVRARVLAEFDAELHRLENRLPASRLSGR